MPERPKGADCKSAGNAFGGSNPSPGTKRDSSRPKRLLSSVVEHFHGKEGVPSSNLGGGSERTSSADRFAGRVEISRPNGLVVRVKTLGSGFLVLGSLAIPGGGPSGLRPQTASLAEFRSLGLAASLYESRLLILDS